MRVRVSHDEESDSGNPNFEARHKHSVNGLQYLGLNNNNVLIFHFCVLGNMSLMV